MYRRRNDELSAAGVSRLPEYRCGPAVAAAGGSPVGTEASEGAVPEKDIAYYWLTSRLGIGEFKRRDLDHIISVHSRAPTIVI